MRLGYRVDIRDLIGPMIGFALIGCSADDVGALGQQTSGIAGPSDASTDDGDDPAEDDDGSDGGNDEDTGAAPANDEVCGNGVDDDADGAIDEQCECTAGQTQPCFPEGPGDPCPGTQICSGVGEIVSWGSCDVDLEACEPEGTTGAEEVDPCESDELLTTQQVLTFQSPLDTLGACPWGQGDNLGQSGGVMAARHEVSLPLEPPEGAVICSTTFEVPETSMYYDDQLYVLFNDVVILAPGDWSTMLPTEDNLLIYDWLLIRGTNGGGGVYCPGVGSVCQLPDTQQDGSIDLDLDVPTQQAVLERAASQGHYTVTVAATGDDNPGQDCDHSTFDLVVTYDYALP